MLTVWANVRPGLGIEYARRDDDGEATIVKAATDCQIMLLRKRDAQPDGTVKFITSVWGMSDDLSVMMQQRRTSNFKTKKVSQSNFADGFLCSDR
jgi:hypothetical protein